MTDFYSHQVQHYRTGRRVVYLCMREREGEGKGEKEGMCVNAHACMLLLLIWLSISSLLLSALSNEAKGG